MSKMKLTIRIVNFGGIDSAMILQDSLQDPHAHQAWQQVKSDLITNLHLKHKNSGGVLAFGELSDTFTLDGGEVYLFHDADPGDLMLKASDDDIFVDLIKKLCLLPSYEMQDQPSTMYGATNLP